MVYGSGFNGLGLRVHGLLYRGRSKTLGTGAGCLLGNEPNQPGARLVWLDRVAMSPGWSCAAVVGGTEDLTSQMTPTRTSRSLWKYHSIFVNLVFACEFLVTLRKRARFNFINRVEGFRV